MKKLVSFGLVLVSSAIFAYSAPVENGIIKGFLENQTTNVNENNQVCLTAKNSEIPKPVFDMDHGGGPELGVKETSINLQGIVSPNPAVNKVKISYDKIDENSNIMVFDALGNEINSGVVVNPGSAELDASALSTGNYFVKINAAGKIYTTSFIVNK